MDIIRPVQANPALARKHSMPAHFGRDEVGVLSAEIDDGDGVVLHGPQEA